MKIEKLPDEVIKKICAGEVITRPYNVVKELLENSIDAGSTNISITISSDVLTVKIEDNGHGIQEEDFKLLCETHCTSKLNGRDGIMQISTYGFRGEALSSISQVAKITVKSKTADSEFGYEAKYSYGKLTDFKPVSLRDGTSFVVKDIFYNNKIRELKFFNKINELNSISNLVFFYAVCNTQSRFVFFVSGKEKFLSKGSVSCECNNSINDIKNEDCSILNKTLDSFHSDLIILRKSILEDLEIIKFHSETCLDRKLSLLESFYNIKDKLHHFDSKYITLICNKPSTDFKKTVFILFVNGRLVENTSLKDYLTKIYQDFLPKYRYPLIYIEIRVPSNDIDINIHPSKKEVMFNHEDIITEILSRVIEIRLKGSFKSEIESNLMENISNRPQFKRYKQSYSENQSNTKIYNDPTITSLYDQKLKDKETLSDNNKLKSENSLTGDDLYKNILNVLQSENFNYSANLFSSLEEEEEVDSLFFKSLTFVGVNQKIEFYVQYNQFLLVCDYETFLLNVIREYLISNLGKLNTKQVQIPVSFEIYQLGILKKYFFIEVNDHVITQVPVVYGQYNDNREDWTVLKIKDKKCHENVKIESFLEILVKIYSKSFELNSVSFNLIKRSTKGTKKNLEMFSVLSSLKDLYKKFGR